MVPGASGESIEHGMDMKTPLNVQLTAFYKRSFAFYTVKERMPVIITNIIDYLVRNKSDIIRLHGDTNGESLKGVIGEMSKLKYEIQTNKPITDLALTAPDIVIWNRYRLEQCAQGDPTYFNTVWLYAECYMYRRIRQVFELTHSLQDFDPFRRQKEDAFTTSLSAMKQLTTFMGQIRGATQDNQIKVNVLNLIKISLWGNKCDLSLSLGESVSQNTNPVEGFEKLQKYILVDQSDSVWGALSSQHNSSEIVRFVTDNAGYELFSDFCLADYIITKKLAKKIHFHVKTIPWFISDVTKHDFHWMIDELSTSQDSDLSAMGKRWREYVNTEQWLVEDNYFWTLPFEYHKMKSEDSDLYSSISNSKLIIFKGDLNYRKLLGEVNWEPTTSFKTSLQGFRPSNLCAFRTLKADIICGLGKGVAEDLNVNAPNWLTSGEFGVIQYCSR